MDEFSDLHNYLLATPESFRKLRYVPETVEKKDKTLKKEDISGVDAFITQAPLWLVGDFQSTRFWGSQGHVEDTCSEGGGRGGNVLLSEPGSLTITGPAGVVVRAEGKLGAVSIEARTRSSE